MCLIFRLAIALLCTSSAIAASQAEDMQLRYITLVNYGGYNVDPVVLHWKTPEGEKDSKNLGAKIGKNEAICYDLTKGGDVPDGSEVWLVAKIEAGETKNCRKDRKHIYNASSSETWWLEMAGTTFNSNRCENVSDKNKDYGTGTYVKGNSDDCR